MYRVRFHGRGGQGLKTASRVLGTALFLEGYEVQDAPRYGAERRGAPVFAYVRAAKAPVVERGVIRRPDLVVVADDSFIAVPGAGVLLGVDRDTVLLIHSRQPAARWKARLSTPATVLRLAPEEETEGAAASPFVGIRCAGAAARLLGTVSTAALERAVRQELATLAAEVVDDNARLALAGYGEMEAEQGCVRERSASSPDNYVVPAWIDVPLESARVAAPAIRGGATSERSKTGLWRTMRPVIDEERCGRCWWVCSTYCPDGAIEVDEAAADPRPAIDYEHCKGCMICVAVCPWHAIEAVAEHEAEVASK